MFKSFNAKNFRCFRDLKFSPLERVNLIAGMNNAGKTALLEAIFLHLGPNNTELPLRINIFRGIEQFAMDPEEMWGWLFFKKRIDETIELTSLNENNRSRILRIRLAEPEVSKTAPPDATGAPKITPSLTTGPRLRQLRLEYKDPDGQTSISRVSITSGGIVDERAQLPPLPLGVFLSAAARFPKEDAERFSKLEAKGMTEEVLTIMRLLEPRLRRLAVLITGGLPVINGDIGIDELVPLPFMGGGMVRLLQILLAIATAPHGTILVDEVDNGFHHSVMADVWKAVAVAARRSNAQVFATTHSWECVKAAHEAFTAGETYDFCLHRLEWIKDKIRLVTYDQEALAAAVKAELEVR